VPPTLSEPQTRMLTAIFERGAEDASQALSRWLDQRVRLTVSQVEEVALDEATDLLGPPEELVAACAIELSGRLTGHLLLVFEDAAGLALADLLLKHPVGTAKSWGELECSAALETSNIVACAYLNSRAVHLPLPGDGGETTECAALLPSPPTFRHEFAGSLLEFALIEQAMRQDRLLLVQTQFTSEQTELHWSLLLVPSTESLESLAGALAELEYP
jgi:chemotaxis protein CheC